MAKGPLSKSALIQTISDKSDGKLTRKDVKGVLEAVATIGHTELKKNGLFVVPSLVRMVVVKKPATKERKGINPFTGGDRLQGQAGPQGRQGPSREGSQRRCRVKKHKVVEALGIALPRACAILGDSSALRPDGIHRCSCKNRSRGSYLVNRVR
jgi:nucleoid DNA-binding protein